MKQLEPISSFETEVLANFSDSMSGARSVGAEYLLGRTLVIDALSEDAGTQTQLIMDSGSVRFKHKFSQDGVEANYGVGGFRWDESSERDAMGVPTEIVEPKQMPSVVWVNRTVTNVNGEITAGAVSKLTGSRARAAAQILLRGATDNLKSINPGNLPKYWPNRLGVHTPEESRAI